MFLIKYIFRLIHITSYGVFSALLINQFLSDSNKFQLNQTFNILLGIAFLLSGLINMIILINENKFLKDKNFKIWKYILYLKFISFIFLTPVFDKFILPLLYNNSENTFKLKIKYKLVFFGIGLLLSPFARFYREKYLKKENKNFN